MCAREVQVYSRDIEEAAAAVGEMTRWSGSEGSWIITDEQLQPQNRAQIESLTSFLCTLVTRLSECSSFEFWSATFHEFFEFEESKQEKTGAWRKYYFDFKKFQKKYLSIFNDFKVYATIHIIILLFFQKLSAFSSFCFAPVVFCFENIHSSKNSIGCAEPIEQRSTY